MKKRLFILLIILVLTLATSVYAEELKISSNLLTDNVQPGGKISYLVTLDNTKAAAYDLTFSIDALPSEIITSSIFEPSKIPVRISSKETKTITVNMFTSERIPPNRNYLVNLLIKSVDNKINQKYPLTIRTIPFKDLLEISLTKDKEISPGKENNFIVAIKNRGNEFLENAELTLKSDALTHFQLINLQPLKTRDFPVKITLDPLIEPSVYSLDIEVSHLNKIIGSFKTDIEVVKYSASKDKTTKEKSFLQTRTIFTRTNNGNIEITSSYSTMLKPFQKTFSSFSPQPTRTIKEAGMYKYEWDFSIKPQNQYNIIIETDYKPLFYLFLLLLIIIYLVIRWLNHGVIVTKKVIKTGENMKVALLVKNNLGIPVKNVELRDILPRSIHPAKDYSTIEPNKIERYHHSIQIIWDILHLDKKEERIISYKLEPKMHLLGKLSLPPARCKYMHKGKEVKHYSNSVSLYPKRE